MTEFQKAELYNDIKEMVKLFGSATELLRFLTISKNRKIVTHRKIKKCKKFLMRCIRIKARIEKGLPIYGKGGILIIAAK